MNITPSGIDKILSRYVHNANRLSRPFKKSTSNQNRSRNEKKPSKILTEKLVPLTTRITEDNSQKQTAKVIEFQRMQTEQFSQDHEDTHIFSHSHLMRKTLIENSSDKKFYSTSANKSSPVIKRVPLKTNFFGQTPPENFGFRGNQNRIKYQKSHQNSTDQYLSKQVSTAACISEVNMAKNRTKSNNFNVKNISQSYEIKRHSESKKSMNTSATEKIRNIQRKKKLSPQNIKACQFNAINISKSFNRKPSNDFVQTMREKYNKRDLQLKKSFRKERVKQDEQNQTTNLSMVNKLQGEEAETKTNSVNNLRLFSFQNKIDQNVSYSSNLLWKRPSKRSSDLRDVSRCQQSGLNPWHEDESSAIPIDTKKYVYLVEKDNIRSLFSDEQYQEQISGIKDGHSN